jgi:uncharacterized phage protein gp47/JayE
MPRIVNGFSLPTLSESTARIRADLEAQFPGEGAMIRGAVWWVVAAVVGGAVYALTTMVAWLLNELFVSTCSERFLALHAQQVHTPRIAATHAEVWGVFNWTAPAGDIVAGSTAVDDDGTLWILQEDIIDPTGYPCVNYGPFVCQLPGAAHNLSDGASLSLSTPIVGIDSEGWALALPTVGTDQEALEVWRARVLLAKRTLPHGGTEADWTEWMLSVDGVDAAWPSSVAGSGVVDGLYIGSATPAHVAAGVAAHRPLAVMFAAAKATSLSVGANVKIKPLPEFDTVRGKVAILASFKSNVEDVVRRRRGPSATIWNSDLRDAATNATGVDYAEFVGPVVGGVVGGANDDVTTLSTQIHVYSDAHTLITVWL